MKTSKAKLVIYHADCLDGLGSAWAAFCKFGHNARYFAARFGDKFPRFNKGSDIYILDFSYPPEILLNAAKTAATVTLIDHHATAMEQCQAFFHSHPRPKNLVLNFDMARSGCVLSWQHFFPQREAPQILLHIEDRDLWLFKFADTQAITSALYEQMPMSLTTFGNQQLSQLLVTGDIQVAQFAKMINRLVKYAHQVAFGDATGLAVNAPSFFSSDLGHVLAKKAGTFGMVYQYDGGNRHWLFALRSVGAFNVGRIAQDFGGGGHVNAAGFMLPDNPFLPSSIGKSDRS
jgi:nanoRNase/pAp phosphatase (c-di-AMP/oligoRNAs hydrolase)